ncbi:MAG: NAD(P)/FAD-dependent oxidoreductase [Candidatus Freyarchaeum deiterrae]
MMDYDFDIVVIGAGVAGLGCASLLASKGYRVAVFEKLPYVGGRATTMNFRGFAIDTGLHALPQGSVSSVAELLSKVGKGFELSAWSEGVNVWADDKWQDISEYRKFSRSDNESFEKLIKAIHETSYQDIDNLDDSSLQEWVEGITDNQNVKDLFGYLGMMITTITDWEEMAASEIIYDMKKNLEAKKALLASGFPKGGTINLVKPMVEVIREKGGVVFTESSINEVLIEDSKVIGVSLEQAVEDAPKNFEAWLVNETEFLRANTVICAVPIWVLERILPSEEFPSWFISKINSLSAETTAAIGYILGLDEALWDDKKYRASLKLPQSGLPFQCFAPSNFDPDIAPQGKFLLSVSCPCQPENALDKWWVREGLDVLWDDLTQIFPGFEDHIEWTLPSRYIGIDGIARKPGMVGKNKPDVKAPSIQGLYFAGDTYRGRGVGMNSAAESAMKCVERIIRDKTEEKQ